MAGLWWITVMMVFCLSAGSLAEIDQNRLATLIYHLTKTVRDEYKIYSMYAVAVSIPKYDNKISYDLRMVTEDLKTSRLVVAPKKDVTDNNGKYRYTEHAEWRLLQNLNLEGQDGELLVFYSYASPCLTSCADPDKPFKITDGLQKLFTKHKWGEKAFVFEVTFKPGGKDIDPDEIKRSTTEALTNIGKFIGSENIFRCYRPDGPYTSYTCIRCFSGGQIVKNCIS